MWTLGGNQELLDTYHQALEDHGIEDKSLAPALRLTTSDVAVSGVNLYPMMLSQTSNRVNLTWEVLSNCHMIEGRPYRISGIIWTKFFSLIRKQV